MSGGKRESSLPQGDFVVRQEQVQSTQRRRTIAGSMTRSGARAAFALTVALAACTRTVSTSPPVITSKSAPAAAGNVTGATSSRAAIETFLAAVKASDLQAMSGIWGTNKGPARDLMKREELEKRLVVMQCLLMHDKWSFVGDSPMLQTGGHQQWQVELTRKSSVAKTAFNTVPGPGGRWFLDDVDVTPLREFCR